MLSANVDARSAPAVACCYPRSFTFYLGSPFPRLKLVRLPLALAATLAALPSISKIPFLDSCVLAFLIRFFETGVSRYGRGSGVRRGLGVGWNLGVGVGVGVAVAVDVAAVVAEAVGVAGPDGRRGRGAAHWSGCRG